MTSPLAHGYMNVPANNGRMEDGSTSDSDMSLNEDETSAVIAAGKATQFLAMLEGKGIIELERESVYGSSIALPQIARSCLWTHTFQMLVIRNYTLLLINYICQLSLVYVVFVELLSFDPLGGTMHLCSFGKYFDYCESRPDEPDCTGPGGEEFTKHNLIADFGDWQTRKMVHDTLMMMWPDKAQQVHESLDPGEWGLESQYCRYICLFLFTLASSAEINVIVQYIYMLRKVPTKGDSWIDKDSDEDKVGEVKFKINGMPMGWKIANVFIVIIPKFFIWFLVFVAGSRLIMKTADIMDTVLNSLAMVFILDIDEIIMTRLASCATMHIMSNIEAYTCYDKKKLDGMTHKEALGHFKKDGGNLKVMANLVPWRLVMIAVIFVAEIVLYYYTNCEQQADGSWISMSTFAPVNVRFDLFKGIADALFDTLDKEPTPIWTMPAKANYTFG